MHCVGYFYHNYNYTYMLIVHQNAVKSTCSEVCNFMLRVYVLFFIIVINDNNRVTTYFVINGESVINLISC